MRKGEHNLGGLILNEIDLPMILGSMWEVEHLRAISFVCVVTKWNLGLNDGLLRMS